MFFRKKKNGAARSMHLSTRIIISFIFISVIPILIIVAAYMLTTKYNMKRYGLDEQGMYNNAMLISRLTNDEYKELKEAAQEDSTLLQDTSYLEECNLSLEEKDSFLVLRKDDEILYNGAEEFTEEELLTILPPYEQENIDEKGWSTIQTEEQILIKQINFRFSDGSEGSVFILSDMNVMYPGLKKMIFDLILIGILVLVATSFCVTFWIYHGIAKPINNLKKAAQNIQEGNLDFTVQEMNSVREMRELCVAFEEMRKRLKKSQDEKLTLDSDEKELIRNISHDLKTPITAVKGYCEGIMDGVADTPEKMNKYIRTIYNKANEMDRLINELTFYSKIDTNRMPYTFTKLNIKEFFDDCAGELELELERERVTFKYKNEIPADTVIIADAEQLRRVINNIISNSVKYMDKPERWIELRVLDAGDFVQVEIEDNGKGIAKKEQGRVFDRFFRTDASRNSARGGSGIGLSIVKKILEDHGGKVWAGGNEGEGTVISFVLRKYQEVPFSEQNTDY